MFAFFKTCLFCSNPLPDIRNGEGEHIFPKSILGFWRSHDVCLECIAYFGRSVDRLAVQNTELIDAISDLRLNNVEPLLENISWKSNDTVQPRTVKMVRRKGKLRVKVTKLDDFLECDETNFEQVGSLWLWEILRGRLSKQAFDAEFASFAKEYRKLKPGESYNSSKFGFTIRRGQTTNAQPEKTFPDEFTRLVAKIVYSFLNYAVRQVDVDLIEEYHSLREHARFDKPLKPFTINWLRPADNKHYPFHSITIYPEHRYCLVDTTFFGKVTWRTVLHTSGEIELEDVEKKSKPEAFRLILDFRNLQNRIKFGGYKFKHSESFAWYEIDG